jgi:hypothetical protein
MDVFKMHRRGMVSSGHTKFHESFSVSYNFNKRDKHTGKDIINFGKSEKLTYSKIRVHPITHRCYNFDFLS